LEARHEDAQLGKTMRDISTLAEVVGITNLQVECNDV
jgi:hypothetical protein